MEIRIPGLILSLALLASAAVAQEDIVRSARTIETEHGDAVVWVEGVLNLQISNQGQTRNQEKKVETLGTVIADDGLTVVPNSSLNPTGMFMSMMRGSGMSMDGQLSDVTLRLTDGTEIDARVVLKDDDLDIAFIAPSKLMEGKGKDLPPFAYVDLTDAAEPELLDRVVLLGRMPKFMNREISVSLGRINSIVEKPRIFYSVNAISAMGTPAFSKSAQVLGISVLRRGRNFKVSSAQNSGVKPIILPAGDILDIAEQARTEIEKSED